MRRSRTVATGGAPEAAGGAQRLSSGESALGRRWPTSRAELESVQVELAQQAAAVSRWRPTERILVGAVFAAPERGLLGSGAAGDRAWVAAVTMDGTRIVDSVTAEGRFGAPYEPGYLALRVGTLLEAAVRSLRIRPDVLLVNGTGFDHPRHAGLAFHLGAMLDLPTIGVTDRTLSRGGGARLISTNPHARPICVHAGWRTDLETACVVVSKLTRNSRTPEPLGQARRLARLARSRESRAERPSTLSPTPISVIESRGAEYGKPEDTER